MGNRLSKTDSAAGTTNYTVDAANRLLTAGASTYTSDLDGNTLTDGTRTNTWDSQNRLVSCTSGGVTSIYTYGADGLRRSSTVNGVTTYYVYDGTMMVREMKQNAQGVLQSTATYLCGPRGPEYRRDDTQAEGTYNDSMGTHPAGKTRWYVYDGLGSVVGEVDPSGNLTSSGTFDVYGAKRQGGTGTATSRQGFVGGLGHVSDAETGLVYMRARYYDPNTGRFESQDAAQSGSNWFVYCSDNPTNLTDFTGKDGIDWVGAILGAIGIKLLDKYADYLINDAPEAKCALGEMLMNIGRTMMGAGESLFEEGSMTMTVTGIMDASNQFGDLEVAGQMAKGTMQGIGGIAEFAAGLTLQSVGEFIYYM